MDFIFKDLSFVKVKDLIGDSRMIEEFMKNYILTCDNSYFKYTLLRNLNDIYVLYTKPCYKSVLRDNEKWWDSYLDNDMFKNLNDYNGLILGFMLINKPNKKRVNYSFIDIIDTRLKGFNLSEMMINKYEKLYNKKLYINTHTEESSNFWFNYFIKTNKLNDVKRLIKNNENIYWFFNDKHTWSSGRVKSVFF